MPRSFFLLPLLFALAACDSGANSCEPGQPEPGQLTLCVTGAYELEAVGSFATVETGAQVSSLHTGDVESGGRVGAFLSFAPPTDDGLDARRYPVGTQLPLLPGTVFLSFTYDDFAETIVTFESVSGAVEVDAVEQGEANTLALTGSFDVTARTGDGEREVRLVGRFR